MKTNGKVAFKGLTIVVAEGKQVGFDTIEIEYEASFSIGEVLQALNIIDILPDKLAEAYRKFTAYQEEFGIQKPEEKTQETVKDAQTEVKDIIKDMLKHEVAEASATEETEE